MGTGMVEESSSATAPTPQKPILASAGSNTSFHLAMIRVKNDFKQGPLPAGHPSYDQEPLYGQGFAHEHSGDERIDRKDSKRSQWVCVPGRLLINECPP